MEISAVEARPAKMKIETNDDENYDFSLEEYDVLLSNVLKCDFEEDISLPLPPPGFIKVKKHKISLVRKSTVVSSLYYNRERVSTDRLRRFMAERKKCLLRNENIFAGHFVKILIDEREEYAQVMGFRNLSGQKDNIASNYMPLFDEKKNRVKNVGAMVSLFHVDVSNNKLRFVKTIVQPISLVHFIRHLEVDELTTFFSR